MASLGRPVLPLKTTVTRPDQDESGSSAKMTVYTGESGNG